MIFNDFKAYRQVLKPIWELKQWRESRLQGAKQGHFAQRFWAIMALMTCLLMLMGCGPGWASEPTNIQYVNAIFLAEGGLNATYPYGIRSITCNSQGICRNICLTTVRNNRWRYKKYGYKFYPRFIQFLASRYCPTKGRTLTQSERKLNKYWVKNVQWFLKHPKKG